MLAAEHVNGDEHRPSEHASGSGTISILHIGKYFPPHRGGMETFLRDLALEQRHRGLNVAAIVHASKRGVRSSWEDAGESEGGMKVPVLRVARWFTFAFAPISPTFPLQLRRCIRRRRPDVLHIHMPNLSPFWCLFIPPARRIPW
ncbi:MAG: glycosyltransferase, partial [Pseudomonadota bacterium]